MRLTIDIPAPQELISVACSVPVASKGLKWSASCLGPNAKETGVYVIHHAGVIKYVGKTNGPTMSYGIRLRREFQEKASGGKHIYPKLVSLKVPPDIMVSVFSTKAIGSLVNAEGVALSTWGKVEIFEAVLTHVYDPEFQRHHLARFEKHVKKLGISKEAFEQLLKTKQS